tara:strand:+ start:2183 stop:4738 length:2556 start_codon:yes stop_codon:yes gene_type:complete
MFSQGVDGIWYFGTNAGIDFSGGAPVPLFNGNLITVEGCATISSHNGGLLFYTNGIDVFNRNHAAMVNGNGLGGAVSSTHSAIIVPKPGSPEIFYIFTTDANGGPNGLQYSEVDMSLDNGLGAVTSVKNVSLFTPTDEKLVAIPNNTNDGYWVVAHKFDSFEFVAYDVNSTGVSANPVISSVGAFTDISNRIGQIKASPNGDRIALARGQTIEAFDFDNSTGTLTNVITITDNENFYGLEFSPSGELIYVSYFVAALSFEGGVNQYNLFAGSEADIMDSRILLTTPNNSGFGALQLGPDGKIYVAKVSTSYLDIIANPNLLAADSNYIPEGLYLEGPESAFGLPTFSKSNFSVEFETQSICEGNMVQFNANIPGTYDTIFWDFGDGNISTVENPIHQYEVFGNYDVTLAVMSGISSASKISTVRVYEVININEIEIVQCDDDSDNGMSTFNLNAYIDDILQDINPMLRDVTEVMFFEDALLANEISGDSYDNVNNPQTVYVEVSNTESNCSAVGEVILRVNSVVSFNVVIDACEDDLGYASFDLSLTDSEVLGNSPPDAEIQYYETYNDALLNTNELDNFYRNSTPNNQIIYVRVDVDTSCYTIIEIELNVIRPPFDSNYSEVFYCIDKTSELLTVDSRIPQDEIDNYSYSWSSGEMTESIQVSEIGTVTLMVTGANGCSSEKTINVLPSSSAYITTIEVIDLTDNNTITVVVTGEGDYVYALDDENGIYQESNSFENVLEGTHTVYVKDAKANCGVVSEDISVLGYPKYFTPNGDSKNDVWEIKGFSSNFPTSSNVQIYNRYGKLITVLNDSNPSWDGTFNGANTSTDDYWFVARFLDGRVVRGHFALKR